MEREPSRDFISTAHSSPRAEVNEALVWVLSVHFCFGFLASLSFFHKKRVLIGTLFLWSERRGCLGFASRSQSFAFCASHKPALSVRSPDSLTLFTPSVRKSARTLFEFSPLSLYILKNTLSGVILKMERETRLEHIFFILVILNFVL